jgi:hypothetical protein
MDKFFSEESHQSRLHNQQQFMVSSALQKAPGQTLAREDLIDAAISLDDKFNVKTGSSRCFTSKVSNMNIYQWVN